MKILFLHGWQSVPGGVKPTFLAQHGHEVINPKLPDDDFAEAVRIAQADFEKHHLAVIVGSSRGGAVAMNLESGDTPLVLLCPAWKKYGAAKTVKPGTIILHSRADGVILFADSEELIRNSGLPALSLIEVGNDHRLADPESLNMMLEACLADGSDEAECEEDVLERDWAGLCYTAVLGWARVAEDDDWLVIHGTVLSERVGKRIGHAWCERADFVLDLVMPVGSRFLKRDEYYRIMQPQVSKTYTPADALLLSLGNAHGGPWDESELMGQ
jgi:hypothetical protein